MASYMTFSRLPVISKCIVAGGGLAVSFLGVRYFIYPWHKDMILLNFNHVETDRYALKKIEEGYQKLQDAETCHSLLKKHLTKKVLDKLKPWQTSLNSSLWDVIRSGVENLDSGVGVYAPDRQSYELFKDLFDPIIADYHKGFSRKHKQPATDFGETKLDQLLPLDPKGKYILSTRVRCARSIKHYPFNPKLREDDYVHLEHNIRTALEHIPEPELLGTYYPLKGMTKDVQQQLIKDHFLFKEGDRFLQSANACRFWPTGRGIYHNKNKTFLVWVNEEDHMRIISMQNGGDIQQVYKRLITALKSLEQLISFERDDHLGWLTFCPSNLGTTIRASVHIRLPKTSARPDFKEICEKMNLQIRGIHGEHSESDTGVYDISNVQRMGLTEFEAVKQMYDGVKALIEMEEKS